VIFVSVSFVYTDWNWLFKISALSTVSVTRIPSRFRGATPELSILMLSIFFGLTFDGMCWSGPPIGRSHIICSMICFS
jgi:hypothetical protein